MAKLELQIGGWNGEAVAALMAKFELRSAETPNDGEILASNSPKFELQSGEITAVLMAKFEPQVTPNVKFETS